MRGILEVREFDTITCNKDYENSPYFRYLDAVHFAELEKFIREYTSDAEHADALEFMKIGYKRNVGNTITLTNNVGIIELPSGFQIEILPKIPFDEEDIGNKKTKQTFLNMLRCLKDFEGKAFGDAALNADRMNLYEIFISMYLKETRTLVKHGIKSAYVSKEENLAFFKGKLDISQHIKANTAHKERFFMRYDEYHVNRAENRLVKAVLDKLRKETASSENAKEIRQLMTYFELVEASTNYEEDFARVSLGRDTKDYEILILWAKVFLMNKSFTTFSGKKAGKAILFPMEQVFEAFVARWVKKIFEEQSHGYVSVSAQDSGYYLFDEPKKFRLRPDIVVRGEEEKRKRVVILDTKWKKLKPDPGTNYGISQADMYQMYAYSKKYHTSEIWLLYPAYPEVAGLDDISFNAVKNEDMKVSVNLFLIDLQNYKDSIRRLYDRIYTRDTIIIYGGLNNGRKDYSGAGS